MEGVFPESSHGFEILETTASGEQILVRYHSGDGQRWFAKIVSPRYAHLQEQAEHAAGLLRASGVSANAAKSERTVSLDSGERVFFYAYLDTRFAGQTNADMEKIGGLLSEFHQACRGGQLASLSEHGGKKKLDDYRSVKQSVLNKTQTLSIFSSEISRILSDSLLPYPDSLGPPQTAHGDINFGNILFTKTDDQPVLLDFEEMSSSYLPACIDIAGAVERFILVQETSPETVVDLGRSMLGSYRAKGGKLPETPFLETSLKFLSTLSLCRLIKTSVNGASVPASEWEKFISLFDKSTQLSMLLNEIEMD